MEKKLNELFISNNQIYRKVDLIIPFPDIMVVEKQSDTLNSSNLDIQSALVITTKDRVTKQTI